MHMNTFVSALFLALSFCFADLTSVLMSRLLICHYSYGNDVAQLVVLDIQSGGALSYFIKITLIISVLFTYPLQCYPVIEIMESYLFNSGKHL